MLDPFGVPVHPEHCWVDVFTAADQAGVAPGTIYSWHSRGHIQRRAGAPRAALYDLREVLAAQIRLAGPIDTATSAQV